MNVSECMTREVRILSPQHSIQSAAQAMSEIDVGVLPVAEGDRLVGMVTDRDIAIRGVGRRCDPDTPVEEVMTKEIKYCFDDEDADEVLDNMADLQIRRLPVLSRDKRLVGIVSLGDLATRQHTPVDQALRDISTPAHALR